MKKHQTGRQNSFSVFSWRAFLLITAFVVFAGHAAAQKAVNQFAHMAAEHAATVKTYIGANKNLRPAMRVDCQNKFGLDSLRQSAGRKAHPYYAAADFNRDQITDFAVVLYDASRAAGERFTLLIFNGTKTGAYKLAFTDPKMDLRQGGIWTDGFGAEDGKTTLTAGVFETDDAIWIEWSGGKYIAHEAESGN